MTSIIRATPADLQLVAEIGKISFTESHKKSAEAKVINSYLDALYSFESFAADLQNPKNLYHLLYHNGEAVGYSKIILNAPHANIPGAHVTKLERIYLLEKFYDLKLGKELFEFNLNLSKTNNQTGMWLFVWKENKRAIRFYEKAGFVIVGSHNFHLAESHSNPNHHMFLKY